MLAVQFAEMWLFMLLAPCLTPEVALFHDCLQILPPSSELAAVKTPTMALSPTIPTSDWGRFTLIKPMIYCLNEEFDHFWFLCRSRKIGLIRQLQEKKNLCEKKCLMIFYIFPIFNKSNKKTRCGHNKDIHKSILRTLVLEHLLCINPQMIL